MVSAPFKMRKTKWYPQPHNSIMSYETSMENATVRDVTICPIVMYDEGLGDPASVNTHQQHASFAPTTQPNCYPDSRIDKVFCMLEISPTKAFSETDALRTQKIGFMPIFTSFLEDITAKDEVTGETIGTILELQTEATDRQCFPLWNTVKMNASYGTSTTFPANVPGLTAGQAAEAVAFDIEKYYDALQYYSNAGKLKKVQGGLKWITLKRGQTRKFLIRLRSKAKFMNPYTQFSLMIIQPKADTDYQNNVAAETTAAYHTRWTIRTRYNEWNENFDFARQ